MTLALAVVLALVTGALFGVRQHARNAELVATRIDGLAEEAAEGLQARFRIYVYGLRGARQTVVTAGDSLSQEIFQRSAASRNIDSEFPGTHGFGFIARVRPADEAAYLSRIRRDRGAGFNIRQLEPHAGEKFVIQYIEPEASNRAAIGLDIASETMRRQAALAALATGEPRLTGPITLVQVTGKPERSMLFLQPVYAVPNTPPAQRRNHDGIGWTYAALVTDEILADFERAHGDFYFVLLDVTDPANPKQIYASGGQAPGAFSRNSGTRTFPVYGRQWQVVITPRPAFVAGLALPNPWAVGSWYAAFGTLLAFLLVLLAFDAQRRRHMYYQRARLAAIVESSPDAIVGTTLQGVVTEWNPAATAMFGFSKDEAVGQAKATLLVPPDRIDEDFRIFAKVGAGEKVSPIETIRLDKDGNALSVEFAASPIRARDGKVIGLAASMRNITERKQIEAQMVQLNSSLEHQVEVRTAELQAYSSLQRAILAHAGYAIIATDVEGTITLFNPAAEALLGYTAKELVGNASPEVFHDPREVAARAQALSSELGRDIQPGFEVFTAKARHVPDVNEWRYLPRSGDPVPVMLTVTALEAIDGSLSGYLGIAADLRERKQRELALEVNERKLRGLFEFSPLGIALIRITGEILEFNDAFHALTGYSEDALRALDATALTPAEYKAQDEEMLRSVSAGGRYGPYEKDLLRRDGSRVPVRLNGVGMEIAGHPCIWAIVEDISLQRAAETAMVGAVAAAEAASNAKSQFLANMSHEIRTPMNAILGMLQLLQRTALDESQRDYAIKTQTAAKRLLDLLNDILDFSKVEAGQQTLESQGFELETLLRDLGVIIGGNVGDRDIEVVFDVDERIPRWLCGDALRLQQVLVNLAGNAVKFTEVGEVVLSARLEDASAEQVQIAFEVSDTGIGIPEDKLDSIFEGFSQAEASTTRRFGGTGLGLAISQRLVRLMGGELEVSSELGRGSRFRFSVAFARFSSPDLTAMPASPEVLAGLRALVVDDNDSARATMMEMVRSLGWVANQAASGEAALQCVQEAIRGGRRFDVILLDWVMPGMDGWETGQRMRKLMDGDDTPVIVMVTAHGRELFADRTQRTESPLDGFLIKPVTLSMLMDAVADARASRGVPRNPRLATASGPQDLSPRLVGMSLLVVEDNPSNQQVISELLQAEGATITIASGGVKALALLEDASTAYDLVLMDIQMPDMDGYTVTRRIRGNPAHDALPIIAMTANVLASDRDACLAAGMDDHIGKPFDLDMVVARILHWSGRGHAGQRGGGPLLPVDGDEILAWPVALARLGGNRSIYGSALANFRQAAQHLMADLQQATHSGDRSAADRHLHTLKAIAGTVGAHQLAGEAARMEAELREAGRAWSIVICIDTLQGVLTRAQHEVDALLGAWGASQADLAPSTLIPEATLGEMIALLGASNMQALEVFASLKPALQASHPATCRKLEAELADLDFRAATETCQGLLEEAL